MKAALLHIGMFREFKECLNTKLILEKYFDCDHYVSTWSKSKQKYVDDNSFKEYDITSNLIDNLLPNATYDILDENLIFTQDVLPSNKMFFHWQNALRMVNESGKSYDLIFLLRSDLFIKYNGDINKKIFLDNSETKDSIGDYDEIFHIDSNVIYGNLIFLRRFIPKTEYHISDIFFFGKNEIMQNFISTLPNFKNNPIVFCPHKDLAYHIINNIKTHTDDNHPFIVEIKRPKKY